MKTLYKKIVSSATYSVRRYQIVLVAILGLVGTGCDDFVDIDPPKDELITASVFTDDDSATAVVLGMYSQMISSLGFAGGYYDSVSVTSALAADELISFRTPNAFYQNELTPDDQAIDIHLWNEAYNYVYTCNVILEKLPASDRLSIGVKNQLEGEARFIRAFCYFYLTNLFGDVPLHLGSDYEGNSSAARTPVDQVYAQIITDLLAAQTVLASDYSWSDGQRTRPNKWAATAFLARVYLFTGNWQEAEIQATAVLSNTSLYGLNEDLNAVFLKNSEEAIWQLQPVIRNLNTLDAFWFIPVSAPPFSVGLTDDLLNAFEPNDGRFEAWVNSITDGQQTWYYPYKYKVRISSEVTEYSMVIRLAEVYLIRGEARAQLNKIDLGLEDLNRIRNRAGILDIDAVSKNELLEAIINERQKELFTEWGHRWLDLKRTGKADQVLGYKPGWDATDVLFPIPLNERLRNHNITQNPGY